MCNAFATPLATCMSSRVRRMQCLQYVKRRHGWARVDFGVDFYTCASHLECPAHAATPPHGGCRGMLGTAALPPCKAFAVTVQIDASARASCTLPRSGDTSLQVPVSKAQVQSMHKQHQTGACEPRTLAAAPRSLTAGMTPLLHRARIEGPKATRRSKSGPWQAAHIPC